MKKRSITPMQMHAHVEHHRRPASWPWWLLACGIAVATWGLAAKWLP